MWNLGQEQKEDTMWERVALECFLNPRSNNKPEVLWFNVEFHNGCESIFHKIRACTDGAILTYFIQMIIHSFIHSYHYVPGIMNNGN